MVEMRRGAAAADIKSLRGLAISVTACIFQTALMLGGLWLGKALRFEPADLNASVALALLVVVAVKMFLTLFSKKERPAYDLSRTATVLALSIALGINTFISGVALGMTADNMSTALITFCIAVPLACLFFSEIGIMLGRQRKELREKRHHTIAILLYLAAIAWHVAF